MEIINFQNQNIRTIDYQNDTWYSVIDVIKVLTEASNPNKYWSDLKRKLSNEGSQLYENIVRLKLMAFDGKSTRLIV